jgi:hypothetical protein
MREEPWDWPPRKRRRFERVEILPPEQPEMHVHVHDARGWEPQRWITIAALFVLALILVRSGPLALLMLSALIGLKAIGAAAVTVIIVALIAWREHRAGRIF